MPGSSWPDEYREMLVRLRRAREAAGLTQVEVAEALGRTQGFVSKVERGDVRIDPIELLHLAELYQVGVLDLLPELSPQAPDRVQSPNS